VLREVQAKEAPLYNAFEQHWTAAGNKVVAKAITDFITE